MNKSDIINAVINALGNNAVLVTRDRVIRGANKIVSESQMREYWDTFGEFKADILERMSEMDNEIGEDMPDAPEMRTATQATKTVTIVPFSATSEDMTVPSDWNVKQILDAYKTLKIDVETGNFDVRLNGGESITTSCESVIPSDGDFIQVASQVKGNK